MLAVVLLVALDARTAAHVAAWEKATTGLVSVRAEFTVARTDAVFQKERKSSGKLLHLRPNSTWLRQESSADPADYEAVISNGERLYLYIGLGKTVTEFRLAAPATDQKPSADLLKLWLWGKLKLAMVGAVDPQQNPALMALLGLPAGELAKLYHVVLFNEDAQYVYLDLRPRKPTDGHVFTRARFALYGPKAGDKHRPYTPARVYVERPNGDAEVWAFGKVEVNPDGVGPEHFRYVEVPGFTLKQAPPSAAPKKP